MPRLFPLLLAPLLLVTAPSAWSQSLQEIYEAARAYDAAYLAARAQAESIQFRTEQSYALRRPNVSASGNATLNESRPPPSLFNPTGDKSSSSLGGLTLNGRQPLFNRGNGATIGQAD